MSNETRILALFEEANPVPDIHAMDSERSEPAAYLATLEKRSSEVTKLDTKLDRPDKTRKVRVWMAAAAVILVVAAIAGLNGLLTGDSSEGIPVVDQPVEVDPPSTLVGSWSSGALSVVFENDEYAFVFDGVLVEHGTYSTESEAMTFTTGEDSPGCAPGETGRWTFETGADSSLTLTGVDDDCFFRAFIYGFVESIVMEASTPIDLTGLPTELNLEGRWGDGATGLAITGNDYAIAIDGEVIDRGTYELQTGPYLLVLESESTDETCATATYGIAIGGGEALLLENDRIGDDECAARSEIGVRPLESGGTFEIPDADASASDDG